MRLKHVTILLLLLFLGLTHSVIHAQSQTPSVTAELAQASITFGDSVSLTVTARNIDAAIDTSSLERLFNVIGRSSSREVNIINGVNTTRVNWVIQIEPKQAGVLTVPPITVGTLKTQPLALNVGEPPVGANRNLFIEISVDKENPYVQSQVLLTVKVWQSINVMESSKANLGSDQFKTVALERDKEYVATRDGKDFLVQEQQFALFPQASGVHTFGPIELRAKIPVDNSRVQGFFTPTRTVKRLSQPITLNVQPRPDSVQGQWWLPAQDVQISDSWSADPTKINANESITRTLEITAVGVSGDQLPDIELPLVDGLKLYADNVDRSSVASDQGIVSTQKVTWAVVPERNGEVEVPPIRLSWFNTLSGQSETAELPAQTVNVTGLIDSPAAPNESVGSNEVNISASNNAAMVGPTTASVGERSRYPSWLLLILGAIALLLLQAIALGCWVLRSRRKNSTVHQAPNTRDAEHIPSLKKVAMAAKAAKLTEFQHAVLHWAEEFWPQTPPNNLLSVAERLQEPKLHKVFSEIDSVLYGTSKQSVYLLEVEKLIHASARQIVDTGLAEEKISSLPVL